jgi:hypothetical protein
LFELTIDDLRDITDSLTGSSLNINDINNYQIIKSIIDILKEKNGINEDNEDNEENEDDNNKEINGLLNEVEFLKLISSSVEQKLNGKTIEEFKFMIENCAKNQPKLLILFDNKKGFEASKEIIRNIINESIFNIEYNYNDSNYEIGYKCICYFKEKSDKQIFKELLILQQLASLSQNKEKKEENKILNTFIDLIETIKDLLSIITKITSKGFPQKFWYQITVKNGIYFCKDMNVQDKKTKKLLEEKSFLEKLLQKMNIYQVEAYKNLKFLKFFYGQQLTTFNDYLRGKIGQSSIKNEVSNLIHFIIGNKYKKEPNSFFYKSSLSFQPIQTFLDEDNIIQNQYPEKVANNIDTFSVQNREI